MILQSNVGDREPNDGAVIVTPTGSYTVSGKLPLDGKFEVHVRDKDGSAATVDVID